MVDPAAVPLLKLEPGQQATLSAPRAIWQIVGGRAEIYARPGVQRRFIGLLGPGMLIVGGTEQSSPCILLPLESCVLRRLAPAELTSSAPDPSAWTELLDGWLSALSLGAARFAPTQPAVRTLATGEMPALARDECVAAAAGVVWSRVVSGSIRFMNGIAEPDQPIALTRTTWLAATADATLACMSTQELLAATGPDDLLAAASRMHDLVMSVIAAGNAALIDVAAAQLIRSQTAGAEGMEAAYGRLNTLMAPPIRRYMAARGDTEFVLGLAAPGTVGPHPEVDDKLPLEDYARITGIRTRRLTLTGSWWHGDIGRLATTRLADGKKVALLPDWLGRYRIHFAGAPSRVLTPALASGLHPEALSCFRPLPSRKVGLRDFLRAAVTRTRGDLVILLTASAAASLLGLVLPVATGAVLDTFVPSRLREETIWLGLVLAGLTVCGVFLHLCLDLARQRMDGALESDIGGKVIDRVLRLPTRFIKGFASADLALRVASVDAIRRTFMNVALDMVTSGLFGLFGLALLFVYSPIASLVALGLFVLLLVVAVLAGFAQVRAVSTGAAMTALETSVRLQMIQNVAVLRAAGAETQAIAFWANNMAEMRARSLRSRRIAIAFDAVLSAYAGLDLAIVLAVLGTSASAPATIGASFAFITTYLAFSGASIGLAASISRVIGTAPIIERARALLGTQPEIALGSRNPGMLTGALEVSNVGFTYPGSAPVLKGISFAAIPGRFIAICGESGSGKTTLLNLLIGFDAPTAGSILYDGQSLAELDLSLVRRQIGLVRQSGRLFGGTVAENILGAHRGTIDDVWRAAELAGIAADIRALPMGVHTIVTEGGTTFSGGQTQRIMIARALVGRPRILILDEATSALDNIVQAEVAANVERLGITRLVVAHRLSTIRNADLVLFLHAGEIVERGTFDGLLQEKGRFAAFVERQLTTG